MAQGEPTTPKGTDRRRSAAPVISLLNRLIRGDLLGRELALATAPLAMWTVFIAVYYAGHPHETDFVDAFIQARVVVVDGWPRAYDLAALEQQRQVYRPTVWFPQNYPPLMTVTVLPFAVLPLLVASWLWSGLMAVVLILCWHLISPAGRLRDRLLWLLVALSLPPVMMVFRWQALYTVAILVVVLAWRLDRSSHQWLAGILLAGASLKPQLAFLLPVALLASGKWRTVVAGAASSLAMGGTLVALVGPAGIEQWLANVQHAHYHPVEDWVLPKFGMATLFPRPYVYLFMAGVAGLVAVAAWRGRASAGSMTYVIGLVGSQVASPFIHPADWVMTVLAMGILLSQTEWRWRKQFCLASFVAGLWVLADFVIPLALVTFALLTALAIAPERSPCRTFRSQRGVGSSRQSRRPRVEVARDASGGE